VPDNRPPSGAPTPQRSHPKRRLSNYILDKRLQLRYVGFVTVVSALLSGTLGFLVWSQESRASQSIINTVDSAGLGADTRAEIIASLSADDSNLVGIMLLVGVGLVFVLSMYLVVMTHKVAGPLHKVSTYFDEMAVGRMSEVYHLRKGDQLIDFYDKFKEMHDTVRARQKSEVAILERLTQRCQEAGLADSADFGHKLAEAVSYVRKRNDLLA